MEWVETMGKTVAEASAEALAQLGVVEQDAEIVVLSEPKPGLFGRVRAEARVRARVRPIDGAPRDAADKARRRTTSARGTRAQAGTGVDGKPSASPAARAPASPSLGPWPEAGEEVAPSAPEGPPLAQVTTRRASEEAGAPSRSYNHPTCPSEELEVSLHDQAEVAKTFLSGVLGSFGVVAEVRVVYVDETTVEVAAEGSDLALLVGPRGATLAALQELARVVVQRRTGARHGRLLVDVAGYRRRRRAALEAFTRDRVQEVLADGQSQALEPMAAADRKVVHDTVNSIAGVSSHSEGEDPGRFVVIFPS